MNFPLRARTEESNFNNFRGQQNEQSNRQDNSEERKANTKAMRATLAINLVATKVFGFSNNEPGEQGLQMEGSANIAFAWDSTDAMSIEYKIPISLLGNISALQQKELSVGLKLNGIQMRTNNSSRRQERKQGRVALENEEAEEMVKAVMVPAIHPLSRTFKIC